MDLQTFLNSRQAGILAFRISRSLPSGLGHRLARSIADRISTRRQLPLVQAIRANRWVVSGEELSGSQLDQAVRENLRHIAQSFYTLFRCLDDPDASQSLVVFNPQIEELIIRSQEGKQGVIVAGLHLSNFDLVFQAAALHGLHAVGLSLPEASQAIEWQHHFRRQAGLEILSASLANFRQVIGRLEAGQTVVTGIDRPVKESKRKPLFFSRRAHLPVHHIQLALKARVPIVLIGAVLNSDGKYHIHASNYLEMQQFSDHQDELLWNAEKVLEIAADMIRLAPHQWGVVQPVWPEVLAELPWEVD